MADLGGIRNSGIHNDYTANRSESSSTVAMNGFDVSLSAEQKPKTDKSGPLSGLINIFKSVVNFFIRLSDEAKDAKALKNFDSGFSTVVGDIRKGKIGYDTMLAFAKMEENAHRAGKGPEDELTKLVGNNFQIRERIGKHEPEILKMQIKEQIEFVFKKSDDLHNMLNESMNTDDKSNSPAAIKHYNGVADRLVDAMINAYNKSNDPTENHSLMNLLNEK